jgi:hypothetical protein
MTTKSDPDPNRTMRGEKDEVDPREVGKAYRPPLRALLKLLHERATPVASKDGAEEATGSDEKPHPATS